MKLDHIYVRLVILLGYLALLSTPTCNGSSAASCFTTHSSGTYTYIRLQGIDCLSQLDSDKIPEASLYLLEIDFMALNQTSSEKQAYWLLATNAVMHTRQHTAARESSAIVPAHQVDTRQAHQRRAQW